MGRILNSPNMIVKREIIINDINIVLMIYLLSSLINNNPNKEYKKMLSSL